MLADGHRVGLVTAWLRRPRTVLINQFGKPCFASTLKMKSWLIESKAFALSVIKTKYSSSELHFE